jgi:AraC-like DNA-binding protein
MGTSGRQHKRIIARFEEFLAENMLQPVYLAEICAATGASERTLRECCQEHLGMGPVHYLWLRRMHLVHRALLLATPETATVTQTAMDHGLWELSRFSAQYKVLFGELPSATLRRQP